VSNAWTDAAESAGIDYTSDTGAQNSAMSIIEGVTNDGATVTSAKSTIDNYFEPQGTPGETFSFTSGTDNLVGTGDDDTFEGYLQQNPFAGGVSNGLSSADRADGGAGEDSLYAELVSEFVGGVPGAENIDIQPRISNIETLEFEARDIAQNAPFGLDIQDLAGNLLNDLGFAGIPIPGGAGGLGGTVSEQFIAGVLDGWQRDIVVDAKNITGHDFLGSTFSDGDLMIENVNTLTAPGGAARNTSDITIGMDHTDNANSDGDASDLTVYFDEDYLISGQAREGQVFYHLLDEDAELAGNPNRLANIDVDGIRFTITRPDGTTEEVNIESDQANIAGTHQGFVNALQAPLQALIDDGTLPEGTQIVLDPTNVDFTFLDDGSRSDDIPAIVLITGDGSPVTATGFSRIEEEIGEYDVYGRFGEVNDVIDQPVTVNIDLFKAGRGGEGGNLVIGGKDQSAIGNGIEVFNINVKGDGDTAVVDQPSNLGTVTSTNNELRIVNITTDPQDAVKDSVASLTIRNGFNELYDGDSARGLESGDLQQVNANTFLGDLSLGTADMPSEDGILGSQRIINLDTLSALGGGDVTFNAFYTGTEDNQNYQAMTGAGNDSVNALIDGDAVDAVTESVWIDTGAGNDSVIVEVDDSFGDPEFFSEGGPSEFGSAFTSGQLDDDGVSAATTDRLMNLDIDTQAGEDYVEVRGMGTWDIDTASDSDTVFINSGGVKGGGDLWNPTGPSAFAPMVLYRAELEISVAGFESVVAIDTGDNFILTEQELNANLLRAIEQNPEIRQLLEAAVGTSDQNLLVQSLIDGVNQVGFQIRQPELIASPAVPVAGSSQVVLAAGDLAGMTRDLVAVGNAPSQAPGTIVNSAPVDTVAEIVALYGDTGAGMFGNTIAADGYTGQIFTSIENSDEPEGDIGDVVNNSHINLGTGANDLVILSANHDRETGTTPGTGSQNTLVFDDLNAGKTSIVNWFNQASTETLIEDSLNGVQAINGNHLLDFTAFLTNMSTDSGSSASAGAEGIEVYNNIGDTTVTLDANSMNFLTVDDLEDIAGAVTAGYSFDSLSAGQVKALIEAGVAGGITYAAETVSNGTTQGLVQGTTARTSIIAVENVDIEIEGDAPADNLQVDNTNLGAYKFFQVIYGVGAEGDDSTVTVNEITVADFGASLDVDNLELNIVGSIDNGAQDFV
jgi:hypothetical protein